MPRQRVLQRYDSPTSFNYNDSDTVGRMKLPNAHLAVVEQEKIAGCLLNPTHRYGASKARFFTGFGFRLEDWETLARALREHGKQHEVSIERETGFGPRYELDGPLNTPDGRTPQVRTVWQLDLGQVAPRLITAYPLEEA